MSPKDTTDLIAAIGPSDRHRTAIRQSWFGRLIGQSTVAVGMVIAYLAAVGLLYHYVGDALQRFQTTNPLLFWAAIGAPLVLVALFSVLPAILRARRERRLYPLAAHDTPPDPGYFRLHPYEATDKDRYARPDGALDEALAWITGTDRPVLYLSGASGSGKSSLVHAGLTPALEAKGWAVRHLRGMGAPLTTLTTALHAPDLHAVPPADDTPPRALIESAGAERTRCKAPPLLVVLDQFEEFLILDGGPEKEAYAALLRDLAENPVPGVILLHVFRSDYRELIFREGLPDPVERDTGFSLPALTRRDAQAFLAGGPVQMEPRGYEALFAGLDRIEDARGLYRPITLNMVGTVLERQGAVLADDPGRLIESYLRDCITTGEARDFAKPVLDMLITEVGTKAPQSAEAIAEATGLDAWQVRATLSDLRGQGLVRQLDGIWEISHDFLARVIGRITGRLRRPWLSRAASPTLALVAAGWLMTLGIGVPAAVQWQEKRVLAEIRALGFAQAPDAAGGYGFKFRENAWLDDDDWRDFGDLALRLPKVTSLDPSGADLVTDLSPVAGLSALTSLDLSYMAGIRDLSPIAGLSALTSLDLSGTLQITDLTPIAGLAALTSLRLTYTDGITDLSPIAGLSALTSLDLSEAFGITDLTPIASLTALTSLNLAGADGITDLSPIAGLTALTSLNLASADGITDLSPIAGLTALTSLNLSFANGITDLSPIAGLSALTSLDLTFADRITDLTPIAELSALTSLDLTRAYGITDLSPIAGLSALSSLDLSYAVGITDLSPIAGLSALTSLDLSSASGISSLAPVDGLPNLERLRIVGSGVVSLADVDCAFLDRIDHDVPDSLLATCDD